MERVLGGKGQRVESSSLQSRYLWLYYLDIHTDVKSDCTDANAYTIVSANVGGQVRLA